MKELKPLYQAVSKEAASQQLEKLSEKWQQKYPVVITSWQRNWGKLTTYFAYPEAIRKLIYTTNTIESYHRQIRKVTKTKGAFTSDMALLKLIYLATKNIEKKWTQPLQNWSITVSQLSIIFENRISLNL
jgi:putative transposase